MSRPDLANSALNDETPSRDVNGPRLKKPEITYDLPYLAAILAEHGGGIVSAELALDLVLNEIVQQARLATGATGAAIALIRDHEMVCRATIGTNSPDLGMHLDTKSGLSGACVQSAAVQICDDTETDDRVDREACRRLGVRSILVLPLLDNSRRIGVFEILSPLPNAFAEREVQTLQALARRIIHSTHEASEATKPIPLADNPSAFSASQQISQSKPPVTQPVIGALLVGKEPKERVLKDVSRRRRDPLTEVLAALVVGFVLLLGWMLGRSTWRNFPLSSVRVNSSNGHNPAFSQLRAVSAPLKQSENNSSKERTVIASTAKRSVRTTSGKPNETPPPGALVISQNGRVIFWAPPATWESDTGTIQEHAVSQATLSPDQIVNRALKTESAKPKLLHVSPEVAASRLIHRVDPQYPTVAREPRVQGVVALQAWIGTDGYVGKLKLMSGDSRLAEAAIEAVKQWQYQPYYVDGRAVDVETEITINFTLP